MVTGTEFLKKVVVPVVLVGFLLSLFKPLYIVAGEIEILYLWILVGIPFGVGRMCMWLVPRGHDTAVTLGIITLNLIVGGLIGGVVVVFQLIQAVWYCLKSVLCGLMMIAGRV